ncbi:uncharacterized protein C8Q71DRAFT_751899 [Rhodofomes roseus]|uniref:Small RNA 2'-O-methyltransferase n=1 Tax=Rhodofomes roseus TaxID=34475 RepID=A0ABQ8KKX1_9APHY|nr:uncharacterized protein C8Q71DRAFT_751899 [Rhodofomes roseus]KAH9838573.1 hypothetical protein C8Q71DRAFT_751899 [Rhodofomes roseus]
MTISAAYQEGTEELTVTFQPPLFLQRRGWVFDVLRREGVREILDVGCGEGSLISCACNPAPWLPPPLPSILETFATTRAESSATASSINDHGTLTEASSHLLPEPVREDFLHPTKVIGLDISAADLEYAAEDSAPSDSRTRWEPLEVQIWEGGLEVVNPAFVGIECIVATEVIEHLPEDVLPQFAPVLLGAYQPRFFLITTPSYTFNARFTAPDAPRTARSGYPDPTKRTSRIFRHHDHKFEWTPQEFAEWCATVADEWDYDVEVGGVGRAVEKDEWGRDDALGYASQVAAFTRRDGEGRAEERQSHFRRMREVQACAENQHTLLVTHQHLAHEKARQPLPPHETGEIIKRTMIGTRQSPIQLGDLWWEESVAAACGGWTELMVAAIAQHADLRLEASEHIPVTEWSAELTEGLPEDESQQMGEVSPYLSASSDESEEPITPLEDDDQPPEDVPHHEHKLIDPWPHSNSENVWDAQSEGRDWSGGGSGWGGSWTTTDSDAAT